MISISLIFSPLTGKEKSKDVENVATVNMQEHVGSEDREFLSESAKSVFYAVKSEPATKADADAAASKHDQYVCEICNNKYKRALNLQLHMEKVHSILGGPVPPDTGEVPESHKCDVCNREFTNAQSLQGNISLGQKIPPYVAKEGSTTQSKI